MSLTARLAAIKAEIGAVGKDQRITSGPAQYAYRGIDAILDAAHQALITHEVTIVPTGAEPVYEMRQTRNGGPLQWVSLTVTWLIISDDDSIAACTVGEALDTSDKATNKAHTAAYKVLLSQLFAIPYSGEDPDADRHEMGAPADPMATAEQYETLLARIKTLPDDLQDDLRAWVRNGPRLDSLTVDQHAEAKAFITACETELEDPDA